MKYQSIKAGDIIVSSPHADNGLVFNKSVILIIIHDKTGTTGVIINKLISNIEGSSILKTLNLPILEDIEIEVNLPVHYGGPVEKEKGMIIHSDDYEGEHLSKITPRIALSTDSKIISDILLKKGPEHKVLILGYAAWTPGQLMEEIKNNDWVVMPSAEKLPSDAVFKLVFQEENLYKWTNALKLSGINISNYSNLAGHA